VLLDELADYLSTGGLGTLGTDLFLSRLYEAPDFQTVLYETSSMAPTRAMRGSAGQAVVENAGLQIVVRGAQDDYAAARLRANDIWRRLDGAGDLTLNGVRYLWIASRQSPFLMMRDANGRPLVACNYDVVKEISTA